MYSSMRINGRQQQLNCKDCDHKFKRLVNDKGMAGVRRNPKADRRFSDETILAIRKQGASGNANWAQIGRNFNCSREMVRQICYGLIYRDSLPKDFRRPPGPADPKCDHCVEWMGTEAEYPCRLGVPDPIIEGVGFARDCEFYETKRGS
jgi:hypothetical protein